MQTKAKNAIVTSSLALAALMVWAGPAAAATASVTASQCASGGGHVASHSAGGSVCVGGQFNGKAVA